VGLQTLLYERLETATTVGREAKANTKPATKNFYQFIHQHTKQTEMKVFALITLTILIAHVSAYDFAVKEEYSNINNTCGTMAKMYVEVVLGVCNCLQANQYYFGTKNATHYTRTEYTDAACTTKTTPTVNSKNPEVRAWDTCDTSTQEIYKLLTADYYFDVRIYSDSSCTTLTGSSEKKDGYCLLDGGEYKVWSETGEKVYAASNGGCTGILDSETSFVSDGTCRAIGSSHYYKFEKVGGSSTTTGAPSSENSSSRASATAGVFLGLVVSIATLI
jgi:hypothetical protein